MIYRSIQLELLFKDKYIENSVLDKQKNKNIFNLDVSTLKLRTQ
jgi:hypothetical protein